MFKKLAIAAFTLASVTTATLALSGAARADDQWDWRHRHHHFSGGNWQNHNGNNWHPSSGQNFHHRRYWGGPYYGGFYGGGVPFLFGAPGYYFDGPDYGYSYGYDDGGYWPHRHCSIHKVRRHHHWVSKRVCHTY